MAHRVTNYFWRSDKLYARITYQDKFGHRRQKAQRVVSDAVCDVPQVLRELRNQIEEGGRNIFVDGRTRLGDYLDLWREITKGGRSEKTNADYETIIRLYIKPDLAVVELAKLGSMQVQALYASMLERGYSSRTIRYTHAVLAAALKQAIRWDNLRKNPLSGITLPKKEHKEMRVLDEAEVKRFLRECAKRKDGLVLELALYTGARPEEYLALQWRNIDFGKGILKVERKVRYNRKGGGWYFGPLKTEKSRRSFPLDEPLLVALRRHKLSNGRRGTKD